MRWFFFLFLLLPSLAIAQPQPVTLTPQEYDQVLTELAQRDPVLKFLMSKQQVAQQEAQKAAKAAEAAPKPADK